MLGRGQPLPRRFVADRSRRPHRGSRASPTSAGPSSRAGWTPRRGGGQLCVAASRVGLPAHLRFAVPWDEETGSFRPDVATNCIDPEWLAARAILTPLNATPRMPMLASNRWCPRFSLA